MKAILKFLNDYWNLIAALATAAGGVFVAVGWDVVAVFKQHPAGALIVLGLAFLSGFFLGRFCLLTSRRVRHDQQVKEWAGRFMAEPSWEKKAMAVAVWRDGGCVRTDKWKAAFFSQPKAFGGTPFFIAEVTGEESRRLHIDPLLGEAFAKYPSLPEGVDDEAVAEARRRYLEPNGGDVDWSEIIPPRSQ